jgi:hypothetical protein
MRSEAVSEEKYVRLQQEMQRESAASEEKYVRLQQKSTASEKKNARVE